MTTIVDEQKLREVDGGLCISITELEVLYWLTGYCIGLGK
jgi:hypothetical protein